jgi:deoxyribodipyrimidine photo-lyase
MKSTVPTNRIRCLNLRDCNPDGKFVLYWMTAYRRTEGNFALQQARDRAISLQCPLLVMEGLRCDYPWASDRFHRFVIEGMRDNNAAFEKTGVAYFPYVEPSLGAGRGMLLELSKQACVVVADDFPCFFHPGMYHRIADKIPCRFELVDSNCLMPLAIADKTFTVAHSYRRWMQKTLPTELEQCPETNPLSAAALKNLKPFKIVDKQILTRWPAANMDKLLTTNGLASLPIDHQVQAVPDVGGPRAAKKLLDRFVRSKLSKYEHDRNEPDENGSTELSPHFHFGHISPHQVFWSIMHSQQWHPGKLSKPNGKVNGFWGVDTNAEALLDQLCTWREIGFNMCWREPNYDRYESLPSWARKTLADHSKDKRPHLYSLEQLELAQTYDPIWNAAQRQLVLEGKIHNYLRMLWGKKILHWSPKPEQALQWMIELNNKYALDGRDPNSYSGIFWVLGRYDRAWGPEREVFGKIRYMTSDNTAKKHHLRQYLKRYSKLD